MPAFHWDKSQRYPIDYANTSAHHWAQEVAEILWRTNFNFRDLLDETVLETAFPQRCRYVQP